MVVCLSCSFRSPIPISHVWFLLSEEKTKIKSIFNGSLRHTRINFRWRCTLQRIRCAFSSSLSFVWISWNPLRIEYDMIAAKRIRNSLDNCSARIAEATAESTKTFHFHLPELALYVTQTIGRCTNVFPKLILMRLQFRGYNVSHTCTFYAHPFDRCSIAPEFKSIPQ